MATILITGATGLVGKKLQNKLLEHGHQIHVLSRSKKTSGQAGVSYFQWDVKAQRIDPAALKGVDHVIHLAGASVAEGRWTNARKKEILSSRVDSARLILNSLKENEQEIKSLISASGIAYYGTSTSDQVFTETDAMGKGFLTEITESWEKAADEFQGVAEHVAKVRISTVLASEGGALPKLAQPIKFGAGAPIGSGKQWLPWIHIDDLVELFIWIMDNSKEGVYNAAAPDHHTNASFTKLAGKQLKRPIILSNVPAFVIKAMLGGQMADEIILNGSRISSQKAIEEGFKFKYPNLDGALENLL